MVHVPPSTAHTGTIPSARVEPVHVSTGAVDVGELAAMLTGADVSPAVFVNPSASEQAATFTVEPVTVFLDVNAAGRSVAENAARDAVTL